MATNGPVNRVTDANSPTHEGYKEQQNLVVPQSSDEPDEADNEKEDSHRNDSSHEGEARDDAKSLSVSCNAHKQQTDHLQTRE